MNCDKSIIEIDDVFLTKEMGALLLKNKRNNKDKAATNLFGFSKLSWTSIIKRITKDFLFILTSTVLLFYFSLINPYLKYSVIDKIINSPIGLNSFIYVITVIMVELSLLYFIYFLIKELLFLIKTVVHKKTEKINTCKNLIKFRSKELYYNALFFIVTSLRSIKFKMLPLKEDNKILNLIGALVGDFVLDIDKKMFHYINFLDEMGVLNRDKIILSIDKGVLNKEIYISMCCEIYIEKLLDDISISNSNNLDPLLVIKNAGVKNLYLFLHNKGVDIEFFSTRVEDYLGLNLIDLVDIIDQLEISADYKIKDGWPAFANLLKEYSSFKVIHNLYGSETNENKKLKSLADKYMALFYAQEIDPHIGNNAVQNKTKSKRL